MLVRELMQKDVVTLEVGDRLDLADDIMRLGRIRHLPVVSGVKVVGMLSQRDLFHAAISTVLQLRPKAEREWLATVPVNEVMSKEVVTIGPDEPVRRAVEVMIERRFGCLPVVGPAGELVGLISESDVLRYLGHLLETSN